MRERFEGIVLFKRKHREHDALVKIFTAAYGTKMFFIKRLEKPNHPMGSQLIPLTMNEYIGTINQEGLSFLTEASTIQFNRLVQSDYTVQAYAAYISQLVDSVVDDNVPNLLVYELFKLALALLNEGKSPEIIATYIEIYLLTGFGVQLKWDACVICGAKQQPFDFSIRQHGVLCQQHFSEDEFRLHISPKAMYITSLLAQINLEQVQTVNVSQETLAEIRRLMDEIYKEYVGIRLKSKSYLDQMLENDRKFIQILKRDKQTEE